VAQKPLAHTRLIQARLALPEQVLFSGLLLQQVAVAGLLLET
jgi:hypothetical protein